MMRRDGQISIDYLAGALIFFGSLLLLVSNVMTTLPQFADSQARDEMELSAWSISEVLMNDEGRWSDNGTTGTDWQNHVDETDVLGLRGTDGTLSSTKIEALTGLSHASLTGVLGTDKNVNIEFRQVVDVDLHSTFSQGGAPSYITEPSYDPDAADTVHYGAKRLAGDELHFLLTQEDHVGWDNVLRVSRDWDFTNQNTETYNLTSTSFVPVGTQTFTAAAGHTQISDGNLLVLSRSFGRAGAVSPASIGNVVTVQRYGVMDGDVMEVTLRIWR